MTITVSTPIGPLALDADDDGICLLSLDGDPPLVSSAQSRAARAHLTDAARQLGEYFDGRRTSFDLPLAMRGTPFQLQVWAALEHIPFGETISYGELARRVGRPKGPRAVGQANGKNPIPIIVPCHRVLASNGIGGYGGGLAMKRTLLAVEGVTA